MLLFEQTVLPFRFCKDLHLAFAVLSRRGVQKHCSSHCASGLMVFQLDLKLDERSSVFFQAVKACNKPIAHTREQVHTAPKAEILFSVACCLGSQWVLKAKVILSSHFSLFQPVTYSSSYQKLQISSNRTFSQRNNSSIFLSGRKHTFR